MDLITPKDLVSASKTLKILGGETTAKFLMRILKLQQVNKGYSPLSHLRGIEFVNAVIDKLEFSYEVSDEDLAKIPLEGPFITISNHPYGGLDGLSHMSFLGPIRPDFKILVNFLLSKIEPVSEFFLPVNPFETHKDVRSSFSGLKEAFNHLSNGCPLGIYPAGEVSTYRFDQKRVTDRKWQFSVIKFIKKTKVPILPIYFDGYNSTIFHLMGMIHPLARTIKLPSELFNKKERVVRIRIGDPISLKDQEVFSDLNEYGKFLRTRTYFLQLSLKEDLKKPYIPKQVEEIVPPVDPALIVKEVEEISKEHELFRLKENSVFCAPSSKIPNIMKEIGRLREVTYREVGEGTNMSIDTDEFDDYYEQLFIWDHEGKAIVGGYRIGKGRDILEKYGIKGFYIQSLFRMGYQMMPILNETLELGRSFVTKEYQKKTFSLFLLWKGILYVLLKHPEYRYLIGPVSLSNSFSDIAKALTVDFMRANFYNYELAEHIRPRKEFKFKVDRSIDLMTFLKSTENDVGKFDRFVQEIDPEFRTPILLKKYLNLNAEIIGFNVDPKFNYCLDALIVLDLLDVPMPTIESLSKEINDNSILERFKK